MAKQEHTMVRAAGMFIRACIVFVTFLALLFFGDVYNRFELVWLALLLGVALIIEGIGKLASASKKNGKK